MRTDDPRFAFTLPGLVHAWLRMLPALLVTWLVAAAPAGPGVREIFIAAILSIFVVVSAAKARGLHAERSVIRVGLERIVGHAINVLMFLLILFLAAGLGGTVGSMAAGAVGLPEALASAVVTVLATMPVFYWFWPVAVLAGVAPEETGRRSGRTPWLWTGPGYTSARRLLASFGSGRRTALILAVGYLWLAVVVATDQYAGEATAFPWLTEALSYGVFYPLWVWLATVDAERLIQAVLDGRAAAEAEAGPGGVG
jgi:hypothetical protein